MFTHTHSGVRAIVVLFIAAMLLLIPGCSEDSIFGPGPAGPIEVGDNPDAIHGSGATVLESRTVSSFDRVALLGEGHVILEQGSEELLTVETDDNLIGYIETEVVDGVLEIRTQSGVDIEPSESVTYRLGMIDVSGIELGGVGSIETGPVTTGDLAIDLGGVGEIVIEQIDTDTLSVEFHGVGTVRIDGGATDTATVEASGVGGFEAPNLRCDVATLDVRGDSAATLWVSQSLYVTVGDTGSVQYYGTPDVTSATESLGSITSVGDK